MSNSALLRKSIYPWLQNVAAFYLADRPETDEDDNEVAMNMFVENAVSLLQTFMKKNPDVAKQHWQNLALAAALASFRIMHLDDIDTTELVEKCKSKCDMSAVKKLEGELMDTSDKSVDEPEKKVTTTAPPSTKREKETAPAPPASTKRDKEKEKETTTAPPPASTKRDKEKDKETTTAPPPSSIRRGREREPAAEEKKKPELSDDDDEDDDPATMDETPDEEEEMRVYRAKLQAEAIDGTSFVKYVHDDAFTNIWPYAVDVDVTYDMVTCVSRVFRTYVYEINPSKTKGAVHDAAGGCLLAVLDYLNQLPVGETRSELITALYDELPFSSKKGIDQVWKELKEKSASALDSKCSTLRLALMKLQ